MSPPIVLGSLKSGAGCPASAAWTGAGGQTVSTRAALNANPPKIRRVILVVVLNSTPRVLLVSMSMHRVYTHSGFLFRAMDSAPAQHAIMRYATVLPRA